MVRQFVRKTETAMAGAGASRLANDPEFVEGMQAGAVAAKRAADNYANTARFALTLGGAHRSLAADAQLATYAIRAVGAAGVASGIEILASASHLAKFAKSAALAIAALNPIVAVTAAVAAAAAWFVHLATNTDKAAEAAKRFGEESERAWVRSTAAANAARDELQSLREENMRIRGASAADIRKSHPMPELNDPFNLTTANQRELAIRKAMTENERLTNALEARKTFAREEDKQIAETLKRDKERADANERIAESLERQKRALADQLQSMGFLTRTGAREKAFGVIDEMIAGRDAMENMRVAVDRMEQQGILAMHNIAKADLLGKLGFNAARESKMQTALTFRPDLIPGMVGKGAKVQKVESDQLGELVDFSKQQLAELRKRGVVTVQ